MPVMDSSDVGTVTVKLTNGQLRGVMKVYYYGSIKKHKY